MNCLKAKNNGCRLSGRGLLVACFRDLEGARRGELGVSRKYERITRDTVNESVRFRLALLLLP